MASALAFENRRLGLPVVDIDAAMLCQCSHANSQARGDILVHTTDLETTDHVQASGILYSSIYRYIPVYTGIYYAMVYHSI